MKHFILGFLLVMGSANAFSQSVERWVITAGSDSSRNIPGYTVSYTLGEVIIGTSMKRYMMVTQGFEQSNVQLKNSVALSGRNAGEDVHLSWVTPYETNTAYFVIERASDTLNAFQPIGRSASSTVSGSNSFSSTYNHIDAFPLKTMNYYRIKMVMQDSSVVHSNTVALILEGENLWLENLYPNPAKDIVNLKIFAKKDTRVQVTISDILSRTVIAQSLQLKAGSNLQQFAIDKLAAAVYYINVTDGTGKKLVAKLIKVNR